MPAPAKPHDRDPPTPLESLPCGSLITGGAGFIGSAVVRHLIARDRRTRSSNVDKLTYAGNLEPRWRRGAAATRYAFAQADIGDAGADARGSSPSIRPDAVIAPGRREPCRPLDRRRRPTSSRPTSSAPSPCCGGALRLLARPAPARSDGFRFHHISTDEVFGSLGAGRPVHRRRRPTTRARPIRPSKAAVRPPGPRLAPHLRPAGADHQLLEQLRAVSLPREADPADDPQRRSTASRCRSTATAATSATGCIVDDHADALLLRAAKGEPGETYNIGGDARAHQPRRSCRTICDTLDHLAPARRRPAPRPDHLRHRPPGPRPPLRHRRRQARARAGLGAAEAVRDGPRATPCAGTSTTAAVVDGDPRPAAIPGSDSALGR